MAKQALVATIAQRGDQRARRRVCMKPRKNSSSAVPARSPITSTAAKQLLARRPGERASRVPERAVAPQADQHGERIEGLAEGEHAEDHQGEVATGLASRPQAQPGRLPGSGSRAAE